MLPYNSYTDEELVELLRQENDRSFAEIYKRYEEPLSHYALQITHDKEDAADIVQEIFVSLWNRRTELQITYSLKSWLYKAVRFQAARYIARHARTHDFLEQLMGWFESEDGNTPDMLLEKNELSRRIKTIIDDMPAKMKEIYLLSREENLSHREISLKLSIAESTVKKQVQKALRFIREKSFADFPILLILISNFFR